MSELENEGGGRLPNAEELVRGMGLIFNNMNIYSAEHSVTKQGVDTCYNAFIDSFQLCDEVMFAVTEEELRVNEDTVPVNNTLVQTFSKHLLAREINNLALSKGITRDQFGDIIEVLCAKPDDIKELGGFSEAIESCGLQNIRSIKIVYQQITEDEVVVSKEEFENAGSTEEEKAASIIAFLKGDVLDDDGLANIREAVSDADKLSDLILKAAEIQKETANLDDGENMAGVVVGCLRRAYEGLSEDKSLDTKKGKSSLKKSLMLLEKDLLEKLENMGDGLEEGDTEFLHESVEEMVDELTIEGLATEYMKKRAAIEANEARLLKFMKAKGIERVEDFQLHEKLSDGGLTVDGWNELLAKSGLGEDGSSGIEALGNLAMLLSSMEDNVAKAAGDGVVEGEGGGGAIVDVMSQVDSELRKMVSKTEQKIGKLLTDLEEDKAAEKAKESGDEKPKEKKLSRAKLLEVFAEIVQELCQPLAVINCSVNMMLSKNLGEISEGQEDMLKLAAESGEKMSVLTDKVMEIAGVPDGMSPDSMITGALYQ